VKVRKIPRDVIDAQNPIMSPDQLEAILWGHYYRLARTRDRRGSKVAKVDHATGLPESANDLLPTYRATRGTELALTDFLVPKQFIAKALYTDDDPANKGLPEKHKEWKAASSISPEHWSEETILAIEENTMRLKLVIHKLAEEGYFITSPEIDEPGKCGELGTDRLVHGQDGFTMGSKVTYKGLQYADAFVNEHPHLKQEHSLLDALGKTKAGGVPEWKKRELANQSLEIKS